MTVRLRKFLDVVITSPMVGLAVGLLCSGALIGAMTLGGCIPRDPVPGRSPNPSHTVVR